MDVTCLEGYLFLVKKDQKQSEAKKDAGVLSVLQTVSQGFGGKLYYTYRLQYISLLRVYFVGNLFKPMISPLIFPSLNFSIFKTLIKDLSDS